MEFLNDFPTINGIFKNMAYLYIRLLFGHKKSEVFIHATTYMNEPWKPAK